MYRNKYPRTNIVSFLIAYFRYIFQNSKSVSIFRFLRNTSPTNHLRQSTVYFLPNSKTVDPFSIQKFFLYHEI